MFLDHSLTKIDTVIAAFGPLEWGWVGTIVIGFIVGVVSKLIVGGKEPTGCLITIIIGIVGSVIALYLGRFIGWYKAGEAPGFIASTVGAIILLTLYHLLTRKSGPSV